VLKIYGPIGIIIILLDGVALKIRIMLFHLLFL